VRVNPPAAPRMVWEQHKTCRSHLHCIAQGCCSTNEGLAESDKHPALPVVVRTVAVVGYGGSMMAYHSWVMHQVQACAWAHLSFDVD
jgi:hypothetical protein